MNYKRFKNFYTKHKYPILPIKPGMALEIHEEIGEKDNKRTWKFKCIVIKVQKPQHPDGTFMVRGIVAGVMIEKIYPLSYAKFNKVILLDEYKVKRAKLYYLRDKIGKQAKLKTLNNQDKKGVDLMEIAIKEKEVIIETKEEVKKDETK